jgi:hypothetical protein
MLIAAYGRNATFLSPDPWHLTPRPSPLFSFFFLKNVGNILNYMIMFDIITIAIERQISGARKPWYQQIHKNAFSG